jgi:acyl carrier protein
MERPQIITELTEIFCDVMDLDDVELQDSMTGDDVEEWDSLSHVRLIVAIEQSFGIKFSNTEIEKLKCVGDLIDAIALKAA